MNKRQTGFGVIEILLVIIVVGVLGATGWYALKSKHKTDQILAQSEKTSQSIPMVTTQNTKNSIPSGYLDIKEWKVMLNTQGSDIKAYKITDFGGFAYADLISSSLSKNYGCTIGGAASIERVTGNTEIYTDGSTAAQVIKTSPETIKKIANFYYVWWRDNGPCYDSSIKNISVASAAQSAENNKSYTIFQSLQASL